MDPHYVQPHFPQQVSSEQSDSDRSEITFSSGTSFAFRTTHENRTHQAAANLPPPDNNVSHIQRQSFTSSRFGRHEHLHRPSVPARHPEYANFSQRLRSYARWQYRNPGPRTLAEAGFFFTNSVDLVRCYQCGIGLKYFAAGDDPLLEHVRHSEDCVFLLEKLGPDALESYKSRCRQRQIREQSHHGPRCKHPEYMTIESRTATFRSWPQGLTQTPTELAEAGLYYTGAGDLVRCFMCDGGLRNWDYGDDPWIEHCRCFPQCPYARQQKGDEYIALVQAASAAENEESEQMANSANGAELPIAMERLSVRDPDISALIKEHTDTCIEMGYSKVDVNEAVKDLQNMGKPKPTIEEIIEMVEIVKERQKAAKESARHQNETPFEENVRLKKMLTCTVCEKNYLNTLFLPCAHLRLCTKCAEPLTHCVICGRVIRQKIKTYLVSDLPYCRKLQWF